MRPGPTPRPITSPEIDPVLVQEAALQLYLGIRVPARYLPAVIHAERLADVRERANVDRLKRRRSS
jgi:hypothetical protein